jgi:hypothetical protein
LLAFLHLGTAVNASLLGNFEIVATTLIAFGLFGKLGESEINSEYNLVRDMVDLLV